MDTLQTYLNGLFQSVPETPATAKAKQDLFDLMTDHYHEELAKGHSDAEALGRVISEFGDIDELLAALDVAPDAASPADEATDGRPLMDEDDAAGYWAGTERFAQLLSLGVALGIASPGVAAVLARYSGALAAMGFFAVAALGVGLIIATSMGYRSVSRAIRALAVPAAVRDLAAVRAAEYSRPRTIGLVGGIMMCILSVIPPIMANEGGFDGTVGAGGFFLFVAFGVYYISYTSIVAGGYQRLTREPTPFVDSLFDHPAPTRPAHPYTARPTQATAERPAAHAAGARPVPRRQRETLRAYYWPVLITLFLLFGFVGGEWGMAFFLLMVGGLFEKPLFGRTKR